MTLTGHLTRSIFDRYHIVSGTDQVEAVEKLAALHGAHEGEPQVRRVVALDEAVAERTGTLLAQSGREQARSRVQVAAALGRNVVSPTMASWNQVVRWLRDMDSLRLARGGTVA